MPSAASPRSLPDRLRLRTPAEVLEAVPFLLGFQPEHSIVALGLRGERQRLRLTLRADLPPVRLSGAALAPLVEPLVRAGVQQVIAVVYPHPGGRVRDRPHADLVEALDAALDRRHIKLADALCVTGGRYRSYRCDDPRCCPVEGHLLPAPSGTSVVAATLTYEGRSPLPSREALVDSLRPPTFLARAGMAQALVRAESAAVAAMSNRAGAAGWRRDVTSRLRALLTDQVDPPRSLTDDEVADLLVALGDIGIRDELADQALGAPAAAVRGWTELTRRAVPPYDVAPATLLAHAAYLSGEGALARVAVERALASDPENQLARLLEQIMDQGISPRALRRTMARGCPPGRRPGGRERPARPAS